MPDLETTRGMLAAARRDLLAISNMLDTERFPDEIFGFLAQQAIEKSLKAWLAFCDQEVPKTHNLRLLLVLLARTGENLTREWELIDLTAFAVQFRYESFTVDHTPLARTPILNQITALFQRVEDICRHA
ncbi:MAG: HEPN domain-containing protein [Magnetococcus sp. DMHC-1]|nr:HEPN domain-containing protein [Magnetococcales bacterium]